MVSAVWFLFSMLFWALQTRLSPVHIVVCVSVCTCAIHEYTKCCKSLSHDTIDNPIFLYSSWLARQPCKTMLGNYSGTKVSSESFFLCIFNFWTKSKEIFSENKKKEYIISSN